MAQPFSYKHLYYFWVVAKEGGMTRAAGRLDMAVQTISAQVRELERALGAQLLRPDGRGVALTDAGARALQQAEAIFELGDALPALVRDASAGSEVRLSLGISGTLPKLVVRRLLQPIVGVPGLRLLCREQTFDDLLGDLAVNRLDLVLADRAAPANTALRVFNHPMGSSALAWYGAASFAATARRRFPQSLNGVPLLLPSTHTAVRPHVDRWLSQHLTAPRIAGEFEDSALLKTFGSTGMGVFPAPELVHEQLLKQYGVKRIGPLHGVVEQFYGISTQRKIIHPLVRQMIASQE